MNPPDPRLHGGLIDESSGCDMIGRIHHHVVCEKVSFCIGRGEHLGDHFELSSTANLVQFSTCHGHLGAAPVGIFWVIEYLAVEIGDPNSIPIEQREEADSAAHQRLREDRADAATADQQHP